MPKLIRSDPKVAFGAPNVGGVATWILKGRWEAGESIVEIAEDFDLKPRLVIEALKFEGVDDLAMTERPHSRPWFNKGTSK